MTARTARRAAVVEIKPDAPAVALSVRSGARRTDRDAATAWTFELNRAEQEMLGPHLTALTEREREVVYAVCAGGQNPQIAERLYIALPTLRTHLMRINQKLGVRSKSETIRFVLARLLEAYRGDRAKRAGPVDGSAAPPAAHCTVESGQPGAARLGEENHRFR